MLPSLCPAMAAIPPVSRRIAARAEVTGAGARAGAVPIERVTCR